METTKSGAAGIVSWGLIRVIVDQYYKHRNLCLVGEKTSSSKEK